MFGPYLSGLFTLFVIAAGFLLAAFVFVLLGLACSSLPGMKWGGESLNCPHCGAETPARDAECHSCGRSFREESMVVRPVIDAPKLRT
ncbi:MAG: hypothetical protein EXS05_11915 [Planctomycetaceae bacterium]|nr:hypothetical protein [Planctomycetaceae bacterium]